MFGSEGIYCLFQYQVQVYNLLQKNFAVIIYQSSSRVGVSRHAMDPQDGVKTQRALKKTSYYFLDNHHTTINVDLSRGKDGSWTLWVYLARNKLKRR